ncbi:MAG: hypothetical protein IKI13_09360 [Bacteroidales bacterium]|nr:hypothetical protein [Bacteroidales bacterium]
MRKALIILLALFCMVSCKENTTHSQHSLREPPKWEELEKGWSHMGDVPTYRLESDGSMYCCVDCARLDYQVINGETRYRIFYPLDDRYYNIVKNPEYGTNSAYGRFQFKAGPYYLNL